MRTYFLSLTLFTICILVFPLSMSVSEAGKKKKGEEKISVLIVDGQSISHPQWKEWTPVLLKALDDSGLFTVDVATSPLKGESLDRFNPRFKNYAVVITIYDGDNWSPRTMRNLERYMEQGGGLVVIHAADNAFPYWEQYNVMTGLGGWANRNENSGPYVYFNTIGKMVRENTPGPGGQHGDQHAYVVETRTAEHPIMKGLPARWLHSEDELYGMLRGPAKNMEILATAYSSEKYGGSQRNEPILLTVSYGNGRAFHTVMGHSKQALSCVGFTTTLIRGCQWAAKKEVNFEVPWDFPGENSPSIRTY